jgi:microcystin-dependent protein
MKKTFILLSILTSFVASAQSIEISPNGGTTNSSAILDLKSTTKGFLLPRMTNAQMRAIPSPAQGLLAYCTDCSTNGDYYFYKGTAWVALGSTTVSVSTTMGSVSANADEKGATISNGVLNLAPADANNPGIVTKTAQTFGGVKTFSNGMVGNVTGNATTVTTNANLTGVVTSTGNTTSIANGVITNAMLANGAVANLSGTNTGDQTLPTLSSLGAVASNSAITGATNTKITYDAKGLVTAGAAATTADIVESTDKKYITDAQQTVINNTSGTNTGDQTLPTLSSLGAVASNAAITGATNTKITYDAKGLVTAGAAATTADIAESTDKKYVTDAQLTVINNTSGTNTGDQTLPTLSSLGAVASNAAITGATNTKITYDAKGLVTAGAAATTADIVESTDKKYVTDAQLTVISNTSGSNSGDNAENSRYSVLVSNATHTGDVNGSTALTIANDAVTTAKISDGAITDSKVKDVAASKITGILPVANGGTGTDSLTVNNLLVGNGTSAVQTIAPTTENGNINILVANGTNWISKTLALASIGTGTPISILPPYLTINYSICLFGVYPSRNGSESYVGEICIYAFNFPPRNWALCDGSIQSISQNQALFSLLGTTYGGDGQSTFALPDLRGRSPIGQGQGTNLSTRVMGQSGGSETTTLLQANIPAHTHTVSYN